MAGYNPYFPAPGYSANHSPIPSTTPNAPGEARLTYFITRNDGSPVALIPADELPFALEYVPRTLSPAQTYGMTYVGPAGHAGATFKPQNDTPAMQRSISQPVTDHAHHRFHSTDSIRQFQAPDALARQAFANSANATPSSMPKRPVSASKALSWRRSDPPTTSSNSASEATQTAINAILRSEAGAETAERIGYCPRDSSPPPSGIVPDQEKKVYCTHWILHGWCGFVQQGCRYKHEMPDKAKLNEIGIKHVPTWWKEQNSVFKMGAGIGGGIGKMGTVCPVMKPEEWLNARKGSDADSERSSSSEGGSDATTLTSESEENGKKSLKQGLMTQKEKVQSVPVILKRPVEEKTTPVLESKKAVEIQHDDIKKPKPSEDEAEKTSSIDSSPIVPPARPSTPADDTRKMSNSSDLIKFTPLLPIQASTTTPSTSQTPKRITPDTITTKARELSSTKPTPTTTNKTMKVFVPAGESPNLHIADAKKRQRTKASRTPSPVQRSKTVDVVKAFDKQVEEAKRSKSGGLTASWWPDNEKEEPAVKRVHVKSGCRPRRPASASPAAKAKAAAEAAEKK